MRLRRGTRSLLALTANLTLATVSATAQVSAIAQEQEVQRALIQRDQQSEDFSLQLRQSQEKIQPAAGDNRHLNERQRLENLSSQQLLDIEKDPPQAPRPTSGRSCWPRRSSDRSRCPCPFLCPNP
jgi:hypothetical protein